MLFSFSFTLFGFSLGGIQRWGICLWKDISIIKYYAVHPFFQKGEKQNRLIMFMFFIFISLFYKFINLYFFICQIWLCLQFIDLRCRVGLVKILLCLAFSSFILIFCSEFRTDVYENEQNHYTMRRKAIEMSLSFIISHTNWIPFFIRSRLEVR